MLSVGDSQGVHSVQRHNVDGTAPSTSATPDAFGDWQQGGELRKPSGTHYGAQGHVSYPGSHTLVEQPQMCPQGVSRTVSSECYRPATVVQQQIGAQQNPPSLLAAALSTSANSAGPPSHYVQGTRSGSSQGAGQFEHVTVMTQLQHVPAGDVRAQPSVRTTICPPSTSANFAGSSSMGVSRLQVHPATGITQQVQLSMPTVSTSSFVSSQPARVSMLRAQPYRNNGARLQKMSISATMLPIMGRGSAKQLASMAVIGDDGPTVRQHLQQQQQKFRLQQQLAMQAKQKAGENSAEKIPKGEGEETSQPGCGPSTSDPSTSANEKAKPVVRAAHLQRPYVPRLSTIQRQRVAAEAVRQLQLQGTSAQNTGHVVLPPISLGPTRPAKARKQSLPSGTEHHVLTAPLPLLQQPARPAQCRAPLPISQVQRSQPQPTVAVISQHTYQHPSNTLARLQTSPSTVQTQMQPVGLRLDSQLCCTTDVKNGVVLPPKKTTARKRPQRPPTGAQVRVATFESPASAPADVKIPPMSNGDNAGFPTQTPQVQNEKEEYVEPERKVNVEILSSNPFRVPAKQQATNGGTSSNPLVPERQQVPAPAPQQKPAISVRPQFMHPHTLHPGTAHQIGPNTRHRITRLPPHVLRQKQEDQMYQRKMYFLKRTIKALVFKNGALCDEVARLNQRIQTVTDERRVLAKRLQHFERNRIRRIQTKMKKEAALAAKISAFQAAPLTVKVEPEREETSQDAPENDDNDNESTKTMSSSCTPSSLTSAAASRVATPEPAHHSDVVHAPCDVGARSIKKSRSKLLRIRKAERAPTRTSIGRKAKKHTSV